MCGIPGGIRAVASSLMLIDQCSGGRFAIVETIMVLKSTLIINAGSCGYKKRTRPAGAHVDFC